jgi:hypothetical protein
LSLFIRHSPQAEVYLTDSVRVTPSDPLLQMIYKFYWFLPPVEDIYPAPRPYSKLAESIPHGGDRKLDDALSLLQISGAFAFCGWISTASGSELGLHDWPIWKPARYRSRYRFAGATARGADSPELPLAVPIRRSNILREVISDAERSSK